MIKKKDPEIDKSLFMELLEKVRKYKKGPEIIKEIYRLIEEENKFSNKIKIKKEKKKIKKNK